MSESESTNAWVTVAEAAEKAQVDSGTVRQWYRSGRIPTRRSEGERGAFLVPLELVLALAQPMEGIDVPASATPSPSIEEALRDLESRHAAELGEARDQLEFLRAQLAELSEENRSLKHELEQAQDQRADLRAQLADAVDDRKGVEARLLTVEAELTQLRRVAARSSITDNSWLDQQTPAYQSPVRRQGMATPAATAGEGGPTAPYSEAPPSDLAGLLAATRPDDDPDEAPPATGRPADDDTWREDDEAARSRAIWTDEAPHPPLGQHDDDLLPDHDTKKGRFGKK